MSNSPRPARRVSLILMSALGLGLSSAAAVGGSSDAAESPSTLGTPSVRAAPLVENIEEKIAIYEGCMEPAIYRNAFERTGMRQALANPPSGVAAAGAEYGWSPSGPAGDFSSRNGRVAGIQIVSTGTDTYRVYAGASSGGLWRTESTSLGTWTSIGDRLPNPAARAFAVDPSDSSRIFVGTGDPGRWKGGGMYVTTDEGLSWNEVALPVDPQDFYRLYFVPDYAGRLIAASTAGVLLSADDGDTWTEEQAGDITDLVIGPSDSRYMYAARKSVGVYRSTDWGDTWSQMVDADLPTGADWERATLAVSRSNPDVVAVVVETGHKISGVYRTTNATATTPDWQDISGTLPPSGDQGFHALSIAIRPDDPKQIFVANSDIARTNDAGGTWLEGQALSGVNIGHADVTNLYFSDVTGNDVLWITNDGGIYRHDFGGATISINGGVNGLAISQINQMDADRAFRVAGLQDNGTIRSIDAGQSWEYVNTGQVDGFNVEITDPVNNHFWYTDGVYDVPYLSHVFRRLSGGNSVEITPLKSNLPLVHDRYSNTMYTTSDEQQGIASRPEDAANTAAWATEVSGFQTDDYFIRAIKGSPIDGKTFIAAYDRPNRRDVTIVRKNGVNWDVFHRENIAPTTLGVVEIPGCGVFPSPQWVNEFWVTLEGTPGTPKILHTVDDGLNWQDVSGNLDQVEQVRSLAVTPFNPLVLYAGTDLGVFRSVDGGRNWEPFMSGLPVVPVWHLRFVVDDTHSGQHKLVAGTFGRGFWERVIALPPILYVDKDYLGTEDGTFEHPYRTVRSAVAAAPVGSVIAIRSNSYVEPQTIAKHVTLVTYGGRTLIW